MDYIIIVVSFISVLFYSYKLHKTSQIVLLLPIFYNFVVLYVVLGVFVFTYAIKSPFDLYNEISHSSIYESIFIFMLSSFCFYLGTMLVKNKNYGTHNLSINIDIKYQKTLVFFIILLYLLYVVGYGVEGLIYRNGYIDPSFERNRIILVVFYVASPFVTILIPFINNKAIKYSVFFVCFLILFSSSARFVVVVPFLYIIGTFLRDQKVKLHVLVFNTLLICVCLIFILQIRYYPHHGLIPNLHSFFTKGIDVDYLFSGLNYAFSFSIFGTAYVLENFTHDNVAFMTSINPLPSRYLNMQYMLDIQTMKPTAPMSAISVLALAGYPILISFYLITGFLFSFFFNSIKTSTLVYYSIVGLFILFTLFSIQYNLRGLIRFFYYSVTLFVMQFLFQAFTFKSKFRV